MSDIAPIRITTARTPRAVRLFRDIAYRLRGWQSFYTPPLRRDMDVLLDRKKHPFHEHATVEYFLAFRGRECVGRIAAIENYAHNSFHEEKVGFFGFFDAVEEPEVWEKLLRAAERWCRQRGLTEMRGPCSFSTNEECGLLVDGFEVAPSVMTTWNPASWPALMESCGYGKAKDLYSWWVDDSTISDRIIRLAEKSKERFERKGESLVIRPMDKSRFTEELALVREVYNSAWEKNWGFIPMTDAELDFLAKELRPVIVPELVQFVEIDGKAAGFAFSLPDYNVILRHANGRIGPREIALFLLLRNRIQHMRMLTMGVVAEYRNRGLETILISESIREARSRGIHACECGWILDDNKLMNRTLESMGCRRHRVHRIYGKALS